MMKYYVNGVASSYRELSAVPLSYTRLFSVYHCVDFTL